MKGLNSKYMVRPRSGMIVKDHVLLKPAHYYYRFAHTMVRGKQQTRDQIVGGAWWMDFEAFNVIRRSSRASDTHISAVARRKLAIAKRWSGKVDVVVKALLVGPLEAYVGDGTIQSFDEKLDTDLSAWIPSNEVAQLYIPGLLEKHPQSGKRIYQHAFEHVEQTRIGWDPR